MVGHSRSANPERTIQKLHRYIGRKEAPELPVLGSGSSPKLRAAPEPPLLARQSRVPAMVPLLQCS